MSFQLHYHGISDKRHVIEMIEKEVQIHVVRTISAGALFVFLLIYYENTSSVLLFPLK